MKGGIFFAFSKECPVARKDCQMNKVFESLFDEMIAIEQKAAKLYRLLVLIFPEDGDFWRELSGDGKTYAAVLSSAKEHFSDEGHFPVGSLDNDFAGLQKTNNDLDETIFEYGLRKPSKQDALLRSLEIEHTCGEYCYDRAIDITAATPALYLFRQLTGKSCKHDKKIRALMNAYGIGETIVRNTEMEIGSFKTCFSAKRNSIVL